MVTRAPRLRHNVIANFGGRGWAVCVQLVAVPFYVRILGLEGFGLVGAYLALVALFGLLDLGFGTAINREFAQRRDRGPAEKAAMRSVLARLETLFWLVAAGLALALWFALPVAGVAWLAEGAGETRVHASAFAWMGVAIASQFPLALYLGGFLGLERQVELNLWLAAFSTLRAAGAITCLLLLDPTPPVFFGWVAVSNLGQCLAMASRLRGALRGRDDVAAPALPWRAIARFAGGASATTAAGTLATQLDRIVLGAVAPLSTLGAYALAWAAAGALAALVAPISSAMFPRLARALADRDDETLAALYRLSSQLVAVVMSAPAATLALFSLPLLTLWTGEPAVATAAAPPLTILAAGSFLSAIVHLPYLLQLAAGRTRLAFLTTAAALCAVAPLIALMALRHGAPGAATGWVAFNLLLLGVGVPLMHRTLLRGYFWKWLMLDILVPALAAFAVIALVAIVIPIRSLPGPALIATIGITAVAGAATALLCAPLLRAAALARAPARGRGATLE